MGVGSPPRAPATVGLGEPVSRPCHAPQLAGTLMTDWTGRMSQAGSPGLHFKEAFGSEGLNQGNHAVPGVWSEAGFGRVASKPSCWSAPRTQILETWEVSSSATSRSPTSLSVLGGRLAVQRSGFQMGRSHEGHHASLHPEEAWERAKAAPAPNPPRNDDRRLEEGVNAPAQYLTTAYREPARKDLQLDFGIIDSPGFGHPRVRSSWGSGASSAAD
ncbi:hypothetical protein Cadr_000014620 [Camelus dromedarius]|uniref:Uncharacterized protein n=1 Tax=Camelus dromedarius TaxID=9838 RepID=A0A5N4DMH3_CAMDR|nr:hypothetical protein Cadr_000014620 [Camelus dromedarius]